MFCLFGSQQQFRFLESEVRLIFSNKPNVKLFHVKSLRRLNETLSTDTIDAIYSHCACKTVERQHHCVGKVVLKPSNSSKEKIGRVVVEDDDANLLIVEARDSDGMIATFEVRTPEWKFERKEHAHVDNDSCPRHTIVLFEPVVLRFNVKDCRTDFWFFSNRCTTTHNHTTRALNRIKFDDNCCS